MQIPIVNGIYADTGPDVRTSYPVNLVPVPKDSGVSKGYLRPADGIVSNGTGPGVDRGGINWNGECYRVMGTKLVKVSKAGTVTTLGEVGGPIDSLVTLDYSFDKLAIVSGGRLYYWDGKTLIQVSDPNLGEVVDLVWVDGYFMTTDGTNLVVTELTDPADINPLKYGSAEIDPDPVKALVKLRNEVYALGRYTTEAFDNVGGDFFPFQRIEGAFIQKGVLGTHACCVFAESVAFLGSGRNESPGIYMGANATAQKISTQEIDQILQEFTEVELSLAKLEARNEKSHQFLYVHLPDRTLVFDAAASQTLGGPVWFSLVSTLDGFEKYRARNFVWCYDKWLVGDPNTSAIGYFTDSISSHWEAHVRWEFGTSIVYNESNGAVFNELELISLAGANVVGTNPKITTSYSVDGLTWSQPKAISIGTNGNAAKRLAWFKQGNMRRCRIQRFQGDSQAHMAFLRLEAELEPLAY